MHKLTLAEMPSHGGHVYGMIAGGTLENAGGSWNYDFNQSFGGDQPHNIMQPYMAVHWIMKL